MKRLLTVLVGVIAFSTLLLLSGCNLGTIFTPATATPAPPTAITLENTAGPGIDWASYQPRSYDDQAELIEIPGGTFTKGNNKTSAPKNETPAHSVTLSTFNIYSHEVTNKMYQLCVNAHKCMYPGLAGTDAMQQFSDSTFADFPVVGVDWHMAKDYCEFTGGRLPTEAEWELAAKGFDGLTYPWGEELPTCDLLNMRACFSPGHVVAGGSYPDGQSPFKVYDMAGNVWEWTNDWYAEDAYSTAGIYGPSNGTEKTLRGGGYLSRPESVTTTFRLSSIPDRAYDDVGFRCVRNAGEIPPEIVVPPEQHDPTTPPGGLDDPGDHDLETTALEIAEAPCVTTENLIRAHFKVMISGAPEIGTVELLVEDPSTHTSAATACMLWPVEEDHYQILCDAPLPASLGGIFPPTWVNMTLQINLTTPAITLNYHTALEVMRCEDPGLSAGWGLTTTLSCPDKFGVTTLSVTNQYYSEVPEFINYAFEGWDMSTCTSFYAENFTCSGTLEGLPPHALSHWFKLPSYPDLITTGYNVYGPEDCPGVADLWLGVVACAEGGGYNILLSTPTIYTDGVSFASGGGGLYPCTQTDLNHWVCTYTPPDPPEPDVTVQICPNLPGGTPGTCTTFHYPFPSEPCASGGPWRIAAMGCLDAANIYFNVDTYLEWLIPGAGFTYSASDTVNSFACTVDPVVVGRLNCSGARPAAPGTLQLCVQKDGDPLPTCNYYADFPTWVAAIPPCGPTGLSKVALNSYGCDPATSNFFCILEVAIDGVTFDEYRVSTNISPLTCVLLDTPPDRIYCYSGFDPTIFRIDFYDTDPLVSFPVSWTISPEACPTLPPPALRQCTDFTTETTCNAQYLHGCKWGISTCTGTYH